MKCEENIPATNCMLKHSDIHI